MSVERLVQTPRGEGRLVVHEAQHPVAVLLLSHGAGGGIDAQDLVALAEALPAEGVTVALFEQPWRRAGRKVAAPPAHLDDAFVVAAQEVAAHGMQGGLPLVVGGRSAGARSAARTALAVGASGCLALAFPLHPPGRPEKSRLGELHGADVTTLVIQGERDAFGSPSEFPDEVDVCVVPFADHSFRVLKRALVAQEDALAIVVEATLEWVVREAAGVETSAHAGTGAGARTGTAGEGGDRAAGNQS
ncbi:alpha/beta hydrolase family protein [Nocardioides malaquae]|uniref:alpha/beta hydrolase family protein n=1 Tax=Nocardioides malaquae TaxID=2773426 RepID=UPI001D0D0AF8|nr:alpha/beta family hydrolase [Nocardioides malaquae]